VAGAIITPCKIPSVGFEWPLWLPRWYKRWGARCRNPHLAISIFSELEKKRPSLPPILGVGAAALMVVNRRPTEQGRTPPLAEPHHWLGEVLLYAGNCVGLLLVVMMIPAS
jgi:hypothetical protein